MKTIDQLRFEYLEEKKDFEYCFAETMWNKITRLQKFQNEGKSNDNVYKRLREALMDDLKKFTDISVTPRASEKAYSRFKELELGTIFECTWHRMGSGKIKKALGQKGREIFHHEHLQPHSEYVDNILIKCTDSHDTYRTLQDYPGVCWILKTEDRELTALGFKSNRIEDGGWESIYKTTGINLLSILDSNCKLN